MLVLVIKSMEAVDEATEVMKLYDLDTQQLHGEPNNMHTYMFILYNRGTTCMFANHYLSCMFP